MSRPKPEAAGAEVFVLETEGWSPTRSSTPLAQPTDILRG